MANAEIIKGYRCSVCKWPVLFILCNDGMFELPYGTDWWTYCTNKTCVNHEGEDYGQYGVDWHEKGEAR